MELKHFFNYLTKIPIKTSRDQTFILGLKTSMFRLRTSWAQHLKNFRFDPKLESDQLGVSKTCFVKEDYFMSKP